METAPLKSFATWARRELITQVSARLTAVLAPSSPERIENQHTVALLERDIVAAGGGAKGKDAIANRVAYTWFNRIIALRFMDANGYTGIGVVSPAHGQRVGQPEILADAKRGNIDPDVVANKRIRDIISGLLDGTRPSGDAQGEAYTLLLAEYCRFWNRSMPFMFEREGDYTELLIPANLLAADSILSRAVAALTEDNCREVEVIGWLYQFYISERKDEVFAGFKKGKKAGAAEIPAATQLFTPDWIVRYLVENSIGRLWMLNRPESRLIDQMDYYIASAKEDTDFLRISSPEELKIIDPACGSGHMLTYAFDLLYAIYEEEGYAPSTIPELILTHNLYGTEIDPRAGALAAFALMMRARAKQRIFLSKNVTPNICVLKPISFKPDELEHLVSKEGDRYAEQAFWNQFQHADTFGSLIRPNEELIEPLRTHIETLEYDTLNALELREAAQAVLDQAAYLSKRYHIAIANPPYMGGKQMDALLSQFMKGEYPEAKSDLFAAFIERCTDLARPLGLVAMITMQSWMFLSSYEKLRVSLLARHQITSMLHLGARAFDSIGGEVVSSTAFVLRSIPRADRSAVRQQAGAFIRLVDGTSESEKVAALRAALAGRTRENGFHLALDTDFTTIPGSPIVYWLTEKMRTTFAVGQPLSEIANPCQGLATTNNGRFTRFWWEVADSKFGIALSRAEAAESSLRWFPYNKGGEFRKWYGNHDVVVNWQHDGREIKEEIARKYPYLKGKIDWVAKNQETYFLPSVSWSKISSGAPAFRSYPSGFVYDVAGTSIFASTSMEQNLLLSFMNSRVAFELLAAIAPTLNYEVGQVANLPVVSKFAEDQEVRVQSLIDMSQVDWDTAETSWNFEQNPLVILSLADTC
ncbi:BREX-1 system adenine-specific DNA-methyltransferase PglX [Buchananella hordeovulneris]|uniref:BREX-1 system adenine-specific DNA-methyltransferase PglX n=1 Tax=Buchananella hordeovulneris TaxID=52770 RepID=UPI000F5DCF3E|nr:BREX-1 system adenine-specific DNA-methyltransferase PglX [Buchananella hordeovulneris]RRD53430.1 BREX-1 system adenine-specific DNA-methyltransferase PglX [Buchananella hordeovulneris]